MSIVFYVSGHGLGHAARTIEVINAVHRKRPELRLAVRTSVPRWFFDTFVRATIRLDRVEVDTGVTQIDSLQLDELATARRSGDFYGRFAERVVQEKSALARLEASVVVTDIPPLPIAAAADAGIPSIAIGNFTWDWIYASYQAFAEVAPHVVSVIAEAYAKVTRTLRLPFHGGFETMGAGLVDIPLIARHATRTRNEMRRLLELPMDSVVVLASFGGYGLRLPFAEIARASDFTVVVTDRETSAPDSESSDVAGPAPRTGSAGRLLRLRSEELAERGIDYPDLVAAADVVVSKPGYGIVSECIANGASLLYTDRGRFAEHDVFVAEMSGVLRCRFIPPDDLMAGRWGDPVRRLLAQPRPSRTLATNGAEIAADQILSMSLRVS